MPCAHSPNLGGWFKQALHMGVPPLPWRNPANKSAKMSGGLILCQFFFGWVGFPRASIWGFPKIGVPIQAIDAHDLVLTHIVTWVSPF